MSKADSTHNIVILGAGWAGLSEAHQLLRHVLPALAAASKITYKVTIVAPTEYFYFKVAAPRGIVAPDLVPTDKLFVKIVDSFKEYPVSEFQFIQGAAVAIETSSSNVIVKPTSEVSLDAEKTVKVPYDSLVISTGTQQASPIWQQSGTDAATRAALKDLHARIPKAQSILVAGGGPAGSETAGELGSAYGKSKDITLLTGADRVLSNLSPRHGHNAETRLKALGVEVINNLRVVSAASESDSKTKLTFNDGTSKTVDVYISAVGEKPNTEFVPAEWKDERGFVKCDMGTLRVVGASHVYTLGSAGSYSKGGIMEIMFATKPLAETIRVDLFSLLPSEAQAKLQPSKPWFPLSLFKSAPSASEHHVPYKPITSETQFVPIGRKGGVGVVFGWKLPSFIVYLLKAKTFMIEKAADVPNGVDYK